MFAGEFIRKGTKVWRFVEGFDRAWSPREFAKLPKPARDFIQRHGYRVDGEILLTADHDHHMNHSRARQHQWSNGHIVATRDIARGDEITNNYRMLDRAFCAAFLKEKSERRNRTARALAASGVALHRQHGVEAAKRERV